MWFILMKRENSDFFSFFHAVQEIKDFKFLDVSLGMSFSEKVICIIQGNESEIFFKEMSHLF